MDVSELSRSNPFNRAIEAMLAVPPDIDDFGFVDNNDRLEEAKRKGINKQEKQLVSRLARVKVTAHDSYQSQILEIKKLVEDTELLPGSEIVRFHL